MKRSGPTKTPRQRKADGLARLEVWLSRPLLLEATREARRRGLTRSALIRELLEVAVSQTPSRLLHAVVLPK